MRLLEDSPDSLLIDYIQPRDGFKGCYMACWFMPMHYLINHGEFPILERALKAYMQESANITYRRDIKQAKIPDYTDEIKYQLTVLKRQFTLNKDHVDMEIQEILACKGMEILVEELAPDQYRCYLHNLILIKFRNSMEMVESGWNPSAPFTLLLDELRSKGPLTVNGHFHGDYYKEPLQRLKGVQFGGKDIYQYPAGSAISMIDAFDATHAILLVGAKKGVKKDIVFYIDPSEPEPKLQTMSYNLFTSRVFNINTDIYVIPGSSAHVPSKTRGPFLIGAKDYEAIQEKHREIPSNTM